MASTHRFHTCMLCEAMCGLDVELGDDGSVLHVRGDREDTFSKGHLCPKAIAIEDIRNDPDRVRTPLRRGPSGFQPVSWSEAIAEAAQRIHELQTRHGPHAVAVYAGNPTVHSFGALLGMTALTGALRGHSNFSATSVDQLPHQLAAYQMFGNQALFPIPDIDRTQFFLIVGGNPVASNGSIMSAPGAAERIKAIRARGGRVVVVDPRLTETALLADTHLGIQPGTDALFLLGLVHVLVHEGLVTPGRLTAFTDGLERLPALTKAFSPEAVAGVTEIAAEQIRTLARDFARADKAVAYGRVGMCTQETGGTAAWLINLINVISGNLDREGGAMFPTPAVDLAELARRLGKAGSYGRFKTRVRGLPEFAGELPVAAMAEEMDTPGDKQIRGLITFAGNPVLSTPSGARLEKALSKLELIISFDLYQNETTRFAHLILPTSFGFERDHFDLALNALAVRNNAKFAPAIFPAAGDTREDFELLVDVAAAIERSRGGAAGLGKALALSGVRKLGSRRALDLLLRLGPHKLSLKKLLGAPHGIDLGALVPRMPGVLANAERRINAVPEVFAKDLTRLEPMLARRRGAELVLIGRRLLRSNNSWMHNSERLTKGKPACTLLMHPADAAERGLIDGANVVVRSPRGQVVTTLEISGTLKRGVVSLPHGYGHEREGVQLRVARRRPGVSINDLTDGAVDPISGNAALSGVSVEVTLQLAEQVPPERPQPTLP